MNNFNTKLMASNWIYTKKKLIKHKILINIAKENSYYGSHKFEIVSLIKNNLRALIASCAKTLPSFEEKEKIVQFKTFVA